MAERSEVEDTVPAVSTEGATEATPATGTGTPAPTPAGRPAIHTSSSSLSVPPMQKMSKHQFTKSLSDISSPIRRHRHHNPLSQRSSRDERSTGSFPLLPSTSAPLTAVTTATSTTDPSARASLELPRTAESLLADPASVSSGSPLEASRRPSSVHLNKDEAAATRVDEVTARQQQQQQQQQHQHQHQHHGHGYGYGHHHHHHLLQSSTGTSPTGIAALAAAAAVVASAQPTPGSVPLPRSTTGGGDEDEATGSGDGVEDSKDRKQDNDEDRQLEVIMDPATMARLEQLRRQQARTGLQLLEDTATQLDGLSTTTSQRLNTAYSSVLTRLHTLQTTVLALRSLAAAARATNRRFKIETGALGEELAAEVAALEEADQRRPESGAADGVGTAPSQEERLASLHSRVRAGRAAVLALSQRVDAVRTRVDGWELADREWQERTRTRLKVLWMILSTGLLAVALAVYVTMRYLGTSSGGSGDIGGNSTEFHIHFNDSLSNRADPLKHLLDEL